jgi:hypothetical protein
VPTVEPVDTLLQALGYAACPVTAVTSAFRSLRTVCEADGRHGRKDTGDGDHRQVGPEAGRFGLHPGMAQAVHPSVRAGPEIAAVVGGEGDPTMLETRLPRSGTTRLSRCITTISLRFREKIASKRDGN